MRQHGLIRRFRAIIRGSLASGMRHIEARQPGAVYEAEIERRLDQHGRLRAATSQLAYLRSRVDSTLRTRREDLSRVEDALVRAARAGDDTRALELLREKRRLAEEIDPMAERARNLAEQLEQAKSGLAELNRTVEQLRGERAEMLSRKSLAEVRLDLAQVLQAVDTRSLEDPALEHARAAILQIEHLVEIENTPAPPTSSPVSAAVLRREAEQEEDLAALARLKAGLS